MFCHQTVLASRFSNRATYDFLTSEASVPGFLREGGGCLKNTSPRRLKAAIDFAALNGYTVLLKNSDFNLQPLKGRDCEVLVVSLKRYPDTRPEFFSKLYSQAPSSRAPSKQIQTELFPA